MIMATLTIRQLDDGVYERLKLRARANKRSLEAEVRVLLDERTRSRSEAVARLQAFHESMGRETGMLSDSTELIRQMRGEE
jgi:plasmid stability protein